MAHRFRDEWLVGLARDTHGVSPAFIESARSQSNQFLGAALVRGGQISAAALGESVAQRYGCQFVRPSVADIDRKLLETVPERICRQHLVLPLQIASTHVQVASANPLDVQAEDAIRFATGRRPQLAYCTPEHIEELIAQVFEPNQVLFDILQKVESSQAVEFIAPNDADDDKGPIDAPVIRLANAIVAKAVELKASDVHIEHEEQASHVRYRVDGILRTGLTLPRYVGSGPLVSRLKIMAKLDVAERRRPQDGQAKVRVAGSPISLRISTLPTQFGEKIVARVLDARRARVSLADLGFRPAVAALLQRQLAADQGFMLVTGPTGAGKTTTLYAAITSLADGETNIVSIEDPIEYQLAGINQVAINERQGLSFASVLRSVLRQDPDVILVGEIRDAETADVVCQAAITGHLVLSTLHTNDSTTALARLVDMGVDRYKVISSLRGVTAQRLVRRLCSCRIAAPFDTLPFAIRESMKRYGLPERAFAPGGCPACQHTGFAGRVLIAEVLEVTAALAEVMARASTSAELRTKAIELGVLESLEEDALWHLTEGHCAVEDIASFVTHVESPSVSAPAPEAEPSPVPRVSRYVVVAEGDEGRRQRLAAQLESAGFEADAVADGPSAVARMSVRPPEALITSARLPLMSGLDLIRYVRAVSGLAALPVIAVHADQDQTVRSQLLDAGASDIVAESSVEPLVLPLLRAAWARQTQFAPAAEVMRPRLPADEETRLASLRQTGLLDTPFEERFDAITRLASRTFNTPIAVVTLVDQDRQWFKAHVGQKNRETPREQAFCAHAILNPEVMVVPDAVLDPRFAENPLVTGDPHIRFYAGCPVAAPDGQPIGTLCLIDRVPRAFNEDDKRTLSDLARLVEREIAAPR